MSGQQIVSACYDEGVRVLGFKNISDSICFWEALLHEVYEDHELH